ncbi:hypothetical protein DPSP01_001177 [Paraphaeosphaeria sporulosa]
MINRVLLRADVSSCSSTVHNSKRPTGLWKTKANVMALCAYAGSTGGPSWLARSPRVLISATPVLVV